MLDGACGATGLCWTAPAALLGGARGKAALAEEHTKKKLFLTTKAADNLWCPVRKLNFATRARKKIIPGHCQIRGKLQNAKLKFRKSPCEKKLFPAGPSERVRKKLFPGACAGRPRKKLFLGGPSTVQNAKLKFRIHLGSLIRFLRTKVQRTSMLP